MKGCKRCEALEKRTKTIEEWDAEHKDHGEKTTGKFLHPSGNLCWIACPCGAKHLRMNKTEA